MFQGIDTVRSVLDSVYGQGEVSLTRAVFRWLNHHSVMKREEGGEKKGGR